MSGIGEKSGVTGNEKSFKEKEWDEKKNWKMKPQYKVFAVLYNNYCLFVCINI